MNGEIIAKTSSEIGKIMSSNIMQGLAEEMKKVTSSVAEHPVEITGIIVLGYLAKTGLEKGYSIDVSTSNIKFFRG